MAVSTPLASTAVVGCLVGGLPLSVLLALHPPVLEPDLDLSLGEAERVGDLDPAPPSEVAVKVELLLQLQCLVSSIRLSAPLPL